MLPESGEDCRSSPSCGTVGDSYMSPSVSESIPSVMDRFRDGAAPGRTRLAR